MSAQLAADRALVRMAVAARTVKSRRDHPARLVGPHAVPPPPADDGLGGDGLGEGRLDGPTDDR